MRRPPPAMGRATKRRAGMATAGIVLSLPAPALATGQHALATSLSGRLTATWHGDPATGCGQDGLCGISGLVSRAAHGGQSVDSGSGPISATAQFDTGGVVRVVRRDPGGAVGGCVDQLGEPSGGVSVEQVHGGFRVSFGNQAFGPLLSAGRCAGPLPGDLTSAYPSWFVAAARVRRGTTVDLGFTRGFSALGLSGAVTSTLRLHLHEPRRAPHFPTPPSPPGIPHLRPPAPAAATVDLEYRLAAGPGDLTFGYTGQSSPGCDVLDACGVVGTEHVAFAGLAGRLSLSGGGALPRGTPRTRPGVLAAVAAGHFALDGGGNLNAGAELSATVQRAAGVACQDSRRVGQLPVSAATDQRALALTVTDSSDPFGGSPLLRTRCPGPSDTDVAGPPVTPFDVQSTVVLARGTVDLGALLRDSPVTIAIAGDGTVATAAYLMHERAQATLTITLLRPPRITILRRVIR